METKGTIEWFLLLRSESVRSASLSSRWRFSKKSRLCKYLPQRKKVPSAESNLDHWINRQTFCYLSKPAVAKSTLIFGKIYFCLLQKAYQPLQQGRPCLLCKQLHHAPLKSYVFHDPKQKCKCYKIIVRCNSVIFWEYFLFCTCKGKLNSV